MTPLLMLLALQAVAHAGMSTALIGMHTSFTWQHRCSLGIVTGMKVISTPLLPCQTT